MKMFTALTRLVSLLGLFMFLWSRAYAQITPSADSYINTATSTTNYGAKTLLDVDGASQITYIQFNLASIPATASISQATLKLYINSVTTAGSFNVDYVNGAWAENTIDSSNAPPLGTTIAPNVDVTAADKNQYILINVTSAVQAWLNGSETNDGIALVANSTFNATFDSKENTTTSHAPELDIAFAGAEGTITGVTTASGSGLTGGGTSGTLDLSLTNACASKQVLQWNGSSWACAAVGTGTVSSVGLTAPSSDFTVSGSPVATSGTLGLNWTVAPTSADTVNAIVKRDANGSFSAGPLSASASSSTAAVTGTDTSSGGVGGVVGFSTNGAAVGGYGMGTNSTGVTGSGVLYGVTGFGSGNSSYGVWGESNGLAGVYGTGYVGVEGTSADGAGVYGAGYSYGVEGAGTVAGSIGVYGIGPGTGVYGTGTTGVYGIGTTGVSGVSDYTGVYAQSGTGGYALEAYNTSSGDGILAGSASGYAAWFNGNVDVDGNLSKAGGSFKIDHPLDPANKYLYHSFVESPDMMNIYNGNVTTDAQGDAVIDLPEWFETLNRDFRYQLTVIGQFAQAMVASKIANHQFTIKTNEPGVEVSWQVTGIRQDEWANAHRIPVEVEKPEVERGFYLHPELYGAPEEKGMLWATAPKAMKQWQEARVKAAKREGTTAKP